MDAGISGILILLGRWRFPWAVRTVSTMVPSLAVTFVIYGLAQGKVISGVAPMVA